MLNCPSSDPFIRDFFFDEEQKQFLRDKWVETEANNLFRPASQYNPQSEEISINYNRYCQHGAIDYRDCADIGMTLLEAVDDWYPERDPTLWFAQMEFIHYKGVGQKFGAHNDDNAEGSNHNRLYTTVTMIQKSEDLEGGSLIVWIPPNEFGDHGPTHIIDLEPFETIIFPSYFMHEVTALVKGDRRILICWGQRGIPHQGNA